MQQVRNVMRRIEKTVHIDHPLTEAQLRMTKYGLDAIPVVDGDELVGLLEKSALFTESQTTTHAANGDKVKDRLTGEVVFCYDTDTIETASGVMEKSGRESLIVVDDEKRLLGLLTSEMIDDNRNRNEDRPVDGRAKTAERQAETSGMAKGNRPGKPGNYSAEPYVNKNGD